MTAAYGSNLQLVVVFFRLLAFVTVAGPFLISFTRTYVADPKNPVATAMSDLYALGVTVSEVAPVRICMSCATTRWYDPMMTFVPASTCLLCRRRSRCAAVLCRESVPHQGRDVSPGIGTHRVRRTAQAAGCGVRRVLGSR
jgi:hypothetical protein